MQKITKSAKGWCIGDLRYYGILASPKFFSACGILPVLPHSSKSPLLPFSVEFQNFHQPSSFWAASQAASSLS
jgi:hypothetical protein